MHQSDAVAAVAAAWCERMSDGDVEGVTAILLADPDTFAIGTQRIGVGREAWLESVREMAGMGVTWAWHDLRAWEIGGAGVAAGEMTATLPNGMRLPMRTSVFLVRDGDVYRIFHMHFSWAVPDEVALPQLESWREQLAQSN